MVTSFQLDLVPCTLTDHLLCAGLVGGSRDEAVKGETVKDNSSTSVVMSVPIGCLLFARHTAMVYLPESK